MEDLGATADVDDMSSNVGDVAYEATPVWLANLVLKANRLLGKYPGLLDTLEQREHAVKFTCCFMLHMAMGERAEPEAHDAIYCMSQLRKAIGALITEAATPARSAKAHLTYAAFDWLQSAAHTDAQSLGLSRPSDLRQTCIKGVAVLRTALSDAANKVNAQ